MSELAMVGGNAWTIRLQVMHLREVIHSISGLTDPIWIRRRHGRTLRTGVREGVRCAAEPNLPVISRLPATLDGIDQINLVIVAARRRSRSPATMINLGVPHDRYLQVFVEVGCGRILPSQLPPARLCPFRNVGTDDLIDASPGNRRGPKVSVWFTVEVRIVGRKVSSTTDEISDTFLCTNVTPLNRNTRS